jgi:hypothetical protein
MLRTILFSPGNKRRVQKSFANIVVKNLSRKMPTPSFAVGPAMSDTRNPPLGGKEKGWKTISASHAAYPSAVGRVTIGNSALENAL